MRERPDREAKHRTGVVGIFATRASVVRVVGTILAEQDDERRDGRRRSRPETLAPTGGGTETQEAPTLVMVN